MTATPHAKGKSRAMWWISGSAAAIVVVLGIAVWATARSSDGASNPRALVHTVSTGPLVISVSEAGTIKAREQEIIKNEVEGQTTLLYLIPEGTRVAKGELLAELDSSRLQDQRIEKQISVKNAEAAYVQAKENLEVVKNQAESDISKAELDHRFALEDLANYENGEYPKLLTEAEAKIQLAEAEQSRSEDRFEASRKLFEQKFISSTELTADELSYKKAQNDVLLAQGDRKLLVEFTHKRKLDELKSNIEQTKLALDRTKLKANADIVQAQANLDAKDLEFKQQTDQLAKIDRQIEKCKLVAPTDGLVVYATTGQGGGWRGNQEPLAEGQTVRERQDLIYLPTANLMMAEIKIHESSLDKVSPGLPVRIAVDALPGKQYFGRVDRIAPLPDAQSQWMNPDLKVYNTQIFIDGEAEGLRTGMSCRAEVIVDQYQDVLSVPVQSVIRVAGKPTVYVMTSDGKTEPRQVELGLDNNQLAHVKSGVDVGERVLMNPPLQDATMDMGEQFASADDSGAVAEALRTARANNGGATTRPASGMPGVEAAAAGGPPAMGAPGAGGPGGEGRGNWGGGQGGGGGGGGFDWANATEEQRAEMRRRRAERGEGGGGGGGGGGNWGGGEGRGQGGGQGGGGWGANMTPEQREEMRRRFENMSPEEREQMRQRWRQGGGGQGGQGGPGGPGAGAAGGPPAGGQ